MFRKAANIVMTCLLLFSTTGMAVSKHYCGEDLISVEITAEAETCCDDSSCCHTETQYFQLDEDFVTTTLPGDFRNLFSVDFFLNATKQEISSPGTEYYSKYLPFSGMPPPRHLKVRLAIHQVYRL